MLKYLKLSVLAVFMVIVLFVAAATAGQGTAEIWGTVMSVDPESGDIMVKDTEGEVVPLTAGQGVDLGACQEGDTVRLKFDDEGIIKSMMVLNGG